MTSSPTNDSKIGDDAACGAGELSVAQCATLACLWEVLAPKPGNVYRGADFEDVTFAEFTASAAAIGPAIGRAGEGVGAAVLAAVRAMRLVAGTNTYLGTVLLLAPLAAAAVRTGSLRGTISATIAALDAEDAKAVYEAIHMAQPGGMGEVAVADVAAPPPADLTLTAAMALAADRDLVARQYADGFADVFATADRIAAGQARGWSLCDAIVRACVELMAGEPDTLIARKCGPNVAAEASARAGLAVEAGEPGSPDYAAALADLDFWLRADGHRRNPGTTADVIAAGLFVLLVERRLELPVQFYG